MQECHYWPLIHEVNTLTFVTILLKDCTVTFYHHISLTVASCGVWLIPVLWQVITTHRVRVTTWILKDEAQRKLTQWKRSRTCFTDYSWQCMMKWVTTRSGLGKSVSLGAALDAWCVHSLYTVSSVNSSNRPLNGRVFKGDTALLGFQY